VFKNVKFVLETGAWEKFEVIFKEKFDRINTPLDANNFLMPR